MKRTWKKYPGLSETSVGPCDSQELWAREAFQFRCLANPVAGTSDLLLSPQDSSIIDPKRTALVVVGCMCVCVTESLELQLTG